MASNIKAGDKFGKLCVIERNVRRGPGKWWKCICECGGYHEVCSSALGSTKSCGCLVNRKGSDSPVWAGFMEFSGSLLGSFKKNAKKRGKKDSVVSVTREYLWDLFLSQNRKCALSGFPLKFVFMCNFPTNIQEFLLTKIHFHSIYFFMNPLNISRNISQRGINSIQRSCLCSFFIFRNCKSNISRQYMGHLHMEKTLT